jgi:hypothetical protein
MSVGTVSVFLIHEKSPRIILSGIQHLSVSDVEYRALRIAEDVTLFLTTKQAIQLADSVLETIRAETAEDIADAV